MSVKIPFAQKERKKKMLTYTSCGAWRMSFQIRAHGLPSSYSSIEGNLNLHKPCGSRLLFFLCYFLFLFFSFNCMRERESHFFRIMGHLVFSCCLASHSFFAAVKSFFCICFVGGELDF